jgi:hypothetical protein
MDPNPYESPKPTVVPQEQPQVPRSWLKDKLQLLFVGLAIIVFGLGPIYFFFYWLVGP